MGKLAFCVNEMLNIHDQWLSKKSPPELLLENQELCFCAWQFGRRIYAGFEWHNIPVSQLDYFFLFLIWHSEILVYMQKFDWSLFSSLVSNLYISLFF
jgi:hypothetical protein